MSDRMYNVQHFILTTKYRKPYLHHTIVKQWCAYYIKHICKLRSARIIALTVQDEHVHLLVDLPRRYSDIGNFMRDLKWFTSYNLREKFAPLKAHKALWGVRYFHRSVGGDQAIVQRYIKNHFGGEA